MNIILNKNGGVTVPNPILGNVFLDRKAENDIIKLTTDINLNVKWYLYFENQLFAFKDFTIIADERFTRKKGYIKCKIIGTDAKEGQLLSTAKNTFISDEFEVEVI